MAKVHKDAVEAAELLFELMQVQKRLFHAVAKEHGLTPPQAGTLWILTPDEGVPMSALAEQLMCDASNVTGIVDKLEARGLAQRGQAEDRRVKVLTLTEAGVALRVVMRERFLTPPQWLTRLSREDQRALREILGRASEALKQDAE